MANKLAVITDDEDPGAWIVARGINEVAKRHTGKIDVDHIDKIKLGDLEDGELLYIMGHGSPTEIHGGYDGKKVAATLVKQGLPKDKKVRIRLLSCETGLYSKKAKEVVIGTEHVKLRESFTRDLKNALTQAKCSSCTLEVPLGNVVVLSDKDGDNAIKPERAKEAVAKCGEIMGGIADLAGVNDEVVDALKSKKPLLKIAQTSGTHKSVTAFFAKWNTYVKTVVYPKTEGWRIVSL